MPGITVVYKHGERTFTPADNAEIVGGQVVEAVSGGRIQKAGAGSIVTLGVALNDAIAPEDLVTASTTDAAGRPVVSAAVLPTTVTVVCGKDVPVTYAANATFGQRLKAAANGTVTPVTSTTEDARAVIGYCSEPAGVTVSTNAVGLAHIF